MLGNCRLAEENVSIFDTALSGESDIAPSNLPTIVFVNCPEVKLPGTSSPVQVSPYPSSKYPLSSTCSQASMTVALPGTSNASATFLDVPAKPEGPFQTLVAAAATWLIISIVKKIAKGALNDDFILHNQTLRVCRNLSILCKKVTFENRNN